MALILYQSEDIILFLGQEEFIYNQFFFMIEFILFLQYLLGSIHIQMIESFLKLY